MTIAGAPHPQPYAPSNAERGTHLLLYTNGLKIRLKCLFASSRQRSLPSPTYAFPHTCNRPCTRHMHRGPEWDSLLSTYILLYLWSSRRYYAPARPLIALSLLPLHPRMSPPLPSPPPRCQSAFSLMKEGLQNRVVPHVVTSLHLQHCNKKAARISQR